MVAVATEMVTLVAAMAVAWEEAGSVAVATAKAETGAEALVVQAAAVQVTAASWAVTMASVTPALAV